MLFMKENGRHGFEFAPRQPRGKAEPGAQTVAAAEPGAAPANPTVVRSAPKAGRRKKAASKKTPATAKKTPARKAARKKA
jgi:hypothetical protein